MKKFYLAMLAMALTLSSCNIESLLSGLIDNDDDDDEENYPSWSGGPSYDDVITSQPGAIGWNDLGNGVCTYMPEDTDSDYFQPFFAFEFDGDLCVRGSYNLLFPDSGTAQAFYQMLSEDFYDTRSKTRATLFYDFYLSGPTITLPLHNGYDVYTANRASVMECCKYWELIKNYQGAAIHLGDSFYDEYGVYHLGTNSLPMQTPWFMNDWNGQKGSFILSLLGQQFGIELEFVIGTNHRGTYTDYKLTRIYPSEGEARESYEDMAGDDEHNISIDGRRVTVTDELLSDYYDEDGDYGYIYGENIVELSTRFIYFFAYDISNPLTIF